ncbi:MAG: hypothetical protein EOP11_06285 [Proteobacteria bacterium]|nr:MAG: hypothetical protein EOP11_06285 [Pseudomonadota bacterium]
MIDKKFATRSLSALVFALGAGQAVQAAPAKNVSIQSLELSEESSISNEEYQRTVSALQVASSKQNWGGSGGLIQSGNYANLIQAGNYANLVQAGNYADLIQAGNYANLVQAGNYGRLFKDEAPDAIPSPKISVAGND